MRVEDRMSVDAYELLMFSADSVAEFDTLFAENGFSHDDLTQTRRRWWCFENPAGGAFFAIVAGRKIAATSYLGGKVLAVAGQTIQSFEIGETATRPEHQRKGLFSRLVKASQAHGSSAPTLIYGTPNSQSTPGYAKLGFEIVESPASWLFILANFRRYLPWPESSQGVVELSGEEYSIETKDFPRLNSSSAAYLRWRFVDAPFDYRFFRISDRCGTWHCAVRRGTLGRYDIVVCSEYFLAGAKAGIGAAAGVVKQAVRCAFDRRTYLGIQIHGWRDTGMSKAWLAARGIFTHRILPICATPSGRVSHADWFTNFQLSDCDIG